MLKILRILLSTNTSTISLNLGLLIFRITISLELIIVHGLKKVGIDGPAEIVPNPFGIAQSLNDLLAFAANMLLPQLIILGLFTRYATLPILAVTLTGYFIVHREDSLIIKDVPFMFSTCFVLLAITGPGKYSLDRYFFKKG